MSRSLRSRMILGSVLWTVGLLVLIHLLSLFFYLHVIPYKWRFGATGPLLISFVLLVAGLFGLRSGLSPFRQLQSSLSGLRSGTVRRIDGRYPREVQPLIDDLNALLDEREKAVKRAIASAGDLAHGLKTPLAVLAQDAARAGSAGNIELAESLSQQVERMRRQIDYHLARARAASGATPNVRSAVASSVEGLVRTVLKLYAGRELDIQVHVPADHSVRVQREDLDEMLGNLLDNACKWTKSRIVVRSAHEGAVVVITIDDNGAGLPETLRTVVLRRGVRADEAAPGSGFGLAIVQDLADLYGGSISLSESPEGGLRARLELPALLL